MVFESSSIFSHLVIGCVIECILIQVLINIIRRLSYKTAKRTKIQIIINL